MQLYLFLMLFAGASAGSFTIDYERDCFLKDGIPFRCDLVSGVHLVCRVQCLICWKLIMLKRFVMNCIHGHSVWCLIYKNCQGQYL